MISMAVITPFFDVVAGVAILAGRSSLLDTGIFKTANTNFTIRHLLALGFIGYGGWNLWKIERAQDKLKKSLGAESFGAEDNAPYAGVFDKMEVTFKIQDADYATFYYTTEIPSGLRRHSDEHIVSYVWGDEYELQDDNWFYLPYDWNGVGEHYLAKVMNKTLKAESFGAESMLVQSDGIMVELMGFDGSYRSDGEVKVGYTTAAELGFEPKQLKPVMWVWDDIEGYGAFMATEDIRFV
jgi:hypothetical protein